ncbi:MAG: hypothetical protein K9J06_15410 [Flavobacteriales bacterium]|nr:hypothetical protein [Flavobacteriales bacterium]
MRQLTVQVEENRFGFLLELLRSLDFVKVNETDVDSRESVIENLRSGLQEVNQIKQGKLKGRPASELLNEL